MKAYLIFSLFVVLMSTVFADDLAKLEDGPDKTVFIKCKKILNRCIKDGKDKKKCINDFKTCMEAPIPQYKKECYRTGRECFSSVNSIKEKNECAKEFDICLKNGVSTKAPTVATTVW
ncbi:hypothetical protein ACROYT_G021051 [Oculina patagonica]